MKASASLQRRLVVGLTLGVTVLWLVATLVTGRVLQRELDEAFDSALQETAQRLLPLAILDIFNREEATGPQRVAPLNAQQEHFSYLVRDAAGKVLLQSRTSTPALFDAHTRQEGFSTSATHRLYSASALRATIFIDIAEPLAYRQKATRDAINALIQPLLLLIPLSVLGTWLLVRVSLRSILSYRDAIEQRGVGDLSPIAAQLPAEINPLALAVNHLMERLRSALDAERSFTANSAHELRTPLAATLAQIQRLRREAPENLQARIAQIEASLRDLARLSEKLMQLAKAEGGGLLSETPQDLALLLEFVVQEVRRGAEAAITLTLPAEPVLSMIDPDAFAILLRNLIENALKHGTPGQAIEITLERIEGACALLRVVNAGPVVPAPLLAQLTGRFMRGASSADGSGLGLAIATAITKGVGATLTLHSPAPGRGDGFEATVRFTATDPA